VASVWQSPDDSDWLAVTWKGRRRLKTWLGGIDDMDDAQHKQAEVPLFAFILSGDNC
jgi:hypothetical protein